MKERILNRSRGTRIRVALVQNTLTQEWLRARLAQRKVYVDPSYLSLILSGKRCGEKAELVLNAAEDIIDGYNGLAV